MKNFLRALFFLFVAALVAHADPVHLGTKNKYPIGNKDVPAKIYALFLQEKANGEKFSQFCTSEYYDSSFMKAPYGSFDGWWNSDKDCIEQGVISLGKSYSYYIYVALRGHEDDIIDAINNKDVQQKFNAWYAAWLKNPTWSEVCDYINDKLNAHFDSSYRKLAATIAQKYPARSIIQWYPEYSTSQIFTGNKDGSDLFYAKETMSDSTGTAPIAFSLGVFGFFSTALINPIYNGIDAANLWQFDKSTYNNLSGYSVTMNFVGAQYAIINDQLNSRGQKDPVTVINFSAVPNDDASTGLAPIIATAVPEYAWRRDTAPDFSVFLNVEIIKTPRNTDAAPASAK